MARGADLRFVFKEIIRIRIPPLYHTLKAETGIEKKMPITLSLFSLIYYIYSDFRPLTTFRVFLRIQNIVRAKTIGMTQ